MNTQFKHIDLKLFRPDFESNLTDLIIDLDHLRKKVLTGSSPPSTFFQLKNIFHTLESVGSARIEGNNTTITEYIETKLDDSSDVNPEIREIQNMEKIMLFIDDNSSDLIIDRRLVSELHKMVVDGLPLPPAGEGDRYPGEYRKQNVYITGSSHVPPGYASVNGYMDELFRFINNLDPPKFDLLKTALAHHRFVWIHPFTNGNGRTVRLFTYAMLVKQGFKVGVGRILNPNAVFCTNRDDYYKYLSLADHGTPQGTLAWCEYVLSGLKDEIEKIDSLLNYDFLKKQVLLPTISYSLDRKFITEPEAKILRRAINKKIIKAADIKDLFGGKSHEVSRGIKKLVDKRMLLQEKEGGRRYVIRFDNNYLLRGIIYYLGKNDFLPDLDESESS